MFSFAYSSKRLTISATKQTSVVTPSPLSKIIVRKCDNLYVDVIVLQIYGASGQPSSVTVNGQSVTAQTTYSSSTHMATITFSSSVAINTAQTTVAWS